MLALRFLPIFVLINVAVIAKPFSSDNNTVNESKSEPVKYNFKQVKNLSLKFPCRPRQRTFLVSSLFSLNGHEKVSLNNFVLYRCDEMSGCCVNGMICAPRNIKEIIYQFDVQHAFKKEYEYIRTIDVHVFNHTSCVCRNSSTYVRNNTMDEPFVSNKTVDN